MSSSKSKAGFIELMLLLRTDRLPESPNQSYELKLDGYRALAIKTGGRVKLRSRNDNDFNGRYPAIVNALSAMPDETVIDGEVVALDESGRPSFNLLQNYGSAGAPLIYYVFDVLVLNGRNVMPEPLVRRREILRDEVLSLLGEPIRESPVLNASLRDLITAVRAQGLEGLVAKHLDSGYEPGKRSGAWQKMRLNQGQEFVIGGYTPSPKKLRRPHIWLLRRFSSHVCGEDAKRLHAGITGATVQEISRAGDVPVPVCKPSRSASRPVGPRAHRRKNERVPMVASPVGRQLRICGMDA